jgi:hypothetical protein
MDKVPLKGEQDDKHVAGLAAILTNIQTEEEILHLRFI